MGNEELAVRPQGKIIGSGDVRHHGRVCFRCTVRVDELAPQNVEEAVCKVEFISAKVQAVHAGRERADVPGHERVLQDNFGDAGSSIEAVDHAGKGVCDQEEAFLVAEDGDTIEQDGFGECGDFGDNGGTFVLNGEVAHIHTPDDKGTVLTAKCGEGKLGCADVEDVGFEFSDANHRAGAGEGVN